MAHLENDDDHHRRLSEKRSQDPNHHRHRSTSEHQQLSEKRSHPPLDGRRSHDPHLHLHSSHRRHHQHERPEPRHNSSFTISSPPPQSILSPTKRESSHSSSSIVQSPPCCCSWQCCCRAFIGICVILGCAMAIVGIFLALRYRSIFVDKLVHIVPLTRDSATYKTFFGDSDGSIAKFYFFNVTNADDVATSGARPILQEIGPYVYVLNASKENVKFNSDETEISYATRRFYYFDRLKSSGSEDDILIQLDFVGYGGLMEAVRRGFGSMGSMMLMQSGRSAPFMTHRVGGLLWGTNDKLYRSLLTVAATLGQAPANAPGDFGFLYGRNGSIANTFTLYTGKNEIHRLEQVKVFNGQYERLNDIWPTANVTDLDMQPYDANMIRGTIGNNFPPDVSKSNMLTVFSSEMLFAVDLRYLMLSAAGNIETLRYGINFQIWHRLTGQLNRAMCDPADRDDPSLCLQDGVLNATKSRNNLPVILSWPHLLEANPYYQGLVDGLNPNEDKYGVYADIDPLTGATVRAAERIQLNFPLRSLPFAGYGKLPKFTLLPVMWAEEFDEISPGGIQKLNELIYDKYYLLRGLAYSLLIASVILVPVSVIVFFIYKCHDSKTCCR